MHFSTVATLLIAAAASVAAAPVELLEERATGIQVYLSNLGYVYGFPAGADPSKEYVCSTAAFNLLQCVNVANGSTVFVPTSIIKGS